MAAGHEDTFHHVRDFPWFDLPGGEQFHLPVLPIPSPTKIFYKLMGDVPVDSIMGVQLTKFMVLQVVAGLIVLYIGWGLSRKVRGGAPVRGRWWNFWESLALFIRDEVVRPTIGTGHHGTGHGDSHHEDPHLHIPHMVEGHSGHGQEHSVAKVIHHGEHLVDDVMYDMEHPEEVAAEHRADKYLPFVWSCFFYVLFCNLLGAIPMLGSATAEINVTAALALVTFVAVVIAGSKESGVGGFWLSLAPKIDVPAILKPFLVGMIWVIEFFGFLIKHGVLAVRLFANIMAGHTVIAVILSFIALAANSWLFYMVVPASILGQIAIGMLELFVAFLQAYIFAFLASLFISAAVNPH